MIGKRTSFVLMLGAIFTATSPASAEPGDDLAILCETSRDSYRNEEPGRVSADFYIVTHSKRLLMGDGNLFFGDADFLFFNGEAKKALFLTFDEEEQKKKGKLGVNLVDNFIVTASNVEPTKALATFDVELEPNGFARDRYKNWRGSCRQVIAANETLLHELQTNIQNGGS